MPQKNEKSNPIIEIEKSIIAALLIDQDAGGTVSSMLEPEDFLSPACKEIFFAMCSGVTDAGDIRTRLVEKGFENAGKIVNDLLEIIPPSKSLPYHCEKIRDSAAHRHLVEAAQKIAKTSTLTEAMAIQTAAEADFTEIRKQHR
jgi:Replicative DNA helicase